MKGGNLMKALLQNKKRMGFNKKYSKELEGPIYEEVIKLFQKKEEMEKQNKCEEVRQIKKEIVERNRGLVIKIARSIFITNPVGSLTFEDLAQEGFIGLMKAIDRFDWEKGFRFSTYAIYRIRQNIVRAIANSSHMIRVPVSARDRAIRYHKIQSRMHFLSGHLPTDKEMQEILRLNENQIKAIKKAKEGIGAENVLSFDVDFYFPDPNSDEHKGRDREKLLEIIVPQSESVVEVVERKFLQEKLEEILNYLTSKEKFVIMARFGLLDDKEKTLQKVGDELGLTRERVRQIQNEALKKIRRLFLLKGFQEYFSDNGRY